MSSERNLDIGKIHSNYKSVKIDGYGKQGRNTSRKSQFSGIHNSHMNGH